MTAQTVSTTVAASLAGWWCSLLANSNELCSTETCVTTPDDSGEAAIGALETSFGKANSIDREGAASRELIDTASGASFIDPPDNLILNGQIEIDEDGNGTPDDWTRSAITNPSNPHVTLFGGPGSVGGRMSRMLRTSFACPIGIEGLTDDQCLADARSFIFGWQQTIYPIQLPDGSLSVEPDTWYEFSVSAAFDGVEPYMTVDAEGATVISNGSTLIAAWVAALGPTYQFYREWSVWVSSQGAQMSFWNAPEWAHRDIASSGLQGWFDVTQYFKTPSQVSALVVRTLHTARGVGYFDNFVLRKVPGNMDPTNRPLNQGGSLSFMQYQGQDFFPIALYGFPLGLIQVDGNGHPIDSDLLPVRNAGFNASTQFNYPGNIGLSRAAFTAANLAMLRTFPSPYRMDGSSGTEFNDRWLDNWPTPYTGASLVREIVADAQDAAQAGFQNLLAFGSGFDEIDCLTDRSGIFLPALNGPEALRDYVHQVMPDIPLYTNFCGVPAPYTGVIDDKVTKYLRTTDLATFTQNLPLALPYVVERSASGQPTTYDAVPVLPRVGEWLRKLSSMAQNASPAVETKLMAFALGTNCWAQWDGEYTGDYTYHCDKYIPFNLQRFLIWDQVVNGAVGVVFSGSYVIDLAYPAQQYFWSQIKILAGELSDLTDVLLEPDYYGDWQASHPDINVMMKVHDGVIYLFTASRSLANLPSVTITLPGRAIASVRALNEHVVSRQVCLASADPICRRSIPVNPNGSSFTDSFVHQDPRNLAPLDADVAGYAVHIYEVVPLLAGDFNADGDVDLADFSVFAGCMNRPGVTTPPVGCTPANFDRADLDQDSDVDLQDGGLFGAAFTN